MSGARTTGYTMYDHLYRHDDGTLGPRGLGNLSDGEGAGAGKDVRLGDPHGDDSQYIVWIVIETSLFLCILCGNTLTICAVVLCRRLARAPSSQFVLSLAISDFLVGFFLPFHMSFYVVGNDLGTHHVPCLLKFTVMVLAFCNSLFSLICISLDRYIYIMHPLHYSTYITKRLAWKVIGCGWLYSAALATTPLYWNTWATAAECDYDQVLPLPFTTLVLTPNFALIWAAMFIIYWRIWREAATARRRHRVHAGAGAGAGKPSDGRSIQVVLLVLGSFSVCWLPFFLAVCARALGSLRVSYYSTVYKTALSLAMANSAMNPLIYAWKNSEFLCAFSQLLRCKMPVTESITNARGRGPGRGCSLSHIPAPVEPMP